MSNLMKIPPCGSRAIPCEQTDRQTDRHDAASSLFFFRKFATAPKCYQLVWHRELIAVCSEINTKRRSVFPLYLFFTAIFIRP